MGYIAPITNYQYSQYVERVISKGYDPYRFVPINRIKPTTNPREYDHPTLNGQILPIKRTKMVQEQIHSKSVHKKEQIEKLQSQLTGKGIYYNESV
ncbi:hypothetical protein ACFFHH_17745 [Cytobacillus solani]|uniref:Uncharacterized protein n=1 Tax=Cytobacillus solani TaxID=1637975 RepID=A0A0Q3SGX3_9BACI|nr:hypothetical protein [Cytobacillus solani]KOP81771.1 hypothetical protein AMS60_04290 [Bacillus sp. FJAT-21945]KQL18708.1 hypothetical protein AN957_09055 [Cytobacillus solani]USK56692.1 hypothetical protein LIS82_09545 [Cytobacillus solani]